VAASDLPNKTVLGLDEFVQRAAQLLASLRNLGRVLR
jgi:hypothetical protein